MPTVHIRDVPEPVLAALRERAARAAADLGRRGLDGGRFSADPAEHGAHERRLRLVARGDLSRPARRFSTRGRGPAVLCTSGQMREHLALAGRPVADNGLGMTRAAAVANVRALRGRLTVLEEGVKVADRLLRPLDTVECSGTRVHDANVVATMLVGGIDTVVTLNERDLARFGGHVRVVGCARRPGRTPPRPRGCRPAHGGARRERMPVRAGRVEDGIPLRR